MDAPLLIAAGLVRRFGGLTAVKDVDLTVRRGEIVGLIGPNGAGKTTLFNLLAGALQPSAGTVTFADTPLAGVKPHRLCRLGLVRTFQITRPFATMSVLENTTVGAFNFPAPGGVGASQARAARQRAWDTLAFVGLDSHAGRASGTLSVPQRKRLELARALAAGPKLLLLDEVMAGLNPKEHDETIELIARIHSQGVTLLIIEHAMKVIMSLSTRIAVLHHGEKIADGAPRDVAADPRVIEAYLGEEYRFAGTS